MNANNETSVKTNSSLVSVSTLVSPLLAMWHERLDFITSRLEIFENSVTKESTIRSIVEVEHHFIEHINSAKEAITVIQTASNGCDVVMLDEIEYYRSRCIRVEQTVKNIFKLAKQHKIH